MDYIPSNVGWDAGDHEAQDAFYVWGPAPPPDFCSKQEALNYQSCVGTARPAGAAEQRDHCPEARGAR
jgi:hypothetical protein